MASQICAVLVFLLLGSVSSVFVIPALTTATYVVATTNNSFDRDINPIIGSLDSHGMSLLLSTGLLAFFMSYGGSQGFFIMLCVFMACIPFFFDGAMSMISASRGTILTASPSVQEVSEENMDEDNYQ